MKRHRSFEPGCLSSREPTASGERHAALLTYLPKITNQVNLGLEKRTPHCKLAVVKSLLAAGRVRATVSALAGGAAPGFGFAEIVGVVAALTPRDFYKSMTTQTDHRIWQDVYRPKTPAGDVYLKLTVIEDVLIVSFKEL